MEAQFDWQVGGGGFGVWVYEGSGIGVANIMEEAKVP